MDEEKLLKPDAELIVIDEASIEDTEQKVESFTEESTRVFLEDVDTMIEDRSSYIDEGGAAKVYSFNVDVTPDQQRMICVKILKERQENPDIAYNKGNSVGEEAKFLEDVTGIEAGGVRSPYYLGHYKSEDKNLLLMEELNAVNLQHILNGTESFPEKFDVNEEFKGLENYLKMLHEMGIAHGDIEARNIMIDRESGQCYVIDFGRSVRLNLLKDETQKKENIDNDYYTLDKVFIETDNILTNT